MRTHVYGDISKTTFFFYKDLKFGRSLLHAGESMFPYPTTEESRRRISPGFLCRSCCVDNDAGGAVRSGNVQRKSSFSSCGVKRDVELNVLKGNASCPVSSAAESSPAPTPELRHLKGRRWRERSKGKGRAGGAEDLQEEAAVVKDQQQQQQQQRHSLPDSVIVRVDSSDSELSTVDNNDDDNVEDAKKKKKSKKRLVGQASFDGLIDRAADGRVGRSVDELMDHHRHRGGNPNVVALAAAGGQSWDGLIGYDSDRRKTKGLPPVKTAAGNAGNADSLLAFKSSLIHLSRDSVADSDDSFFSADEDDRTTIDVTLDSQSLPSPALSSGGGGGGRKKSTTTTTSLAGVPPLPYHPQPHAPLLQRSSTEASSVSEFFPALSGSASGESNNDAAQRVYV